VSLAAAREHWRFLLKTLLIFVGVVVVGPLALYALIAGSLAVGGSLGFGADETVVFVGCVFVAACLAWLFTVLAIGNRGAAPRGPADAGAAPSGSHGERNDG
jgi:hypothetical protein